MFCYWKEAAVDSMPTRENLNLDLVKNTRQHAERRGPDAVGVWDTVKRALRNVFRRDESERAAPAYSGNPADYLNVFRDAVSGFQNWPIGGKLFVENMIQNEVPETGLRNVTATLVSDTTKHFKTYGFSRTEQVEIVDALMRDVRYREIAKAQFQLPDPFSP